MIRSLRHEGCLLFLGLLLVGFAPPGMAQRVRSSGKAATSNLDSPFPAFLHKNFDYASFTRFEAEAPPANRIFQSNGFFALEEGKFGKQTILIAAPVAETPSNTGDCLSALEIDAPIFTDLRTSRTYDFAESPAARHVTYYADRTVYDAAFHGGPELSFVVYPIYGKSAAVLRINVKRADGPLRITLPSREKGFRKLEEKDGRIFGYGSSRWPYRLLLATRPKAKVEEGTFEWELRQGSDASAIVTLGGTEGESEAVLRELSTSRDLFDRATHNAWNEYLASTPLVAPSEPMRFTVGTSGEQQTIAPDDLVRSELWTWRGLLTNTVQVNYLPASPLVLADWEFFMGMWSNDGIAETLSLSATNRKDIARAAILNWFRYAVNANGDGNAAWTMFPSGRNTFSAKGPERDTLGVPLQAALVGQYVRLTGDTKILDEKPGGIAQDRTLWQALLAYQRNLSRVRDLNHDHLIDWMHIYETGWDDKNSPFVDRNGAPTSTVNEQVFNLWSLQEMIYLSRLRGEDPSEWQEQFAAAKEAVRTKLWDEETQRYWDLDVSTGKLWTEGENLDAYYFLYYESDPSRIAAMMKRLRDPLKFNGPLLPTLAFDTPKWGGYWRGPSWPREYSHFSLALSRAGQAREAFDWLARGINTNLGPVVPENVKLKEYPHEKRFSPVRIMGYTALDCLAFPDVAGLRIWGGQDLTVKADPTLGKVYVRNAKWLGDSYDAIFAAHQPTRIWRNGRELRPLPADKVWRARKQGNKASFEEVDWEWRSIGECRSEK